MTPAVTRRVCPLGSEGVSRVMVVNGISSSSMTTRGLFTTGAWPFSSPTWVVNVPTSTTWLTASFVTCLSRTVSVCLPFSVTTER